jgi:hypothetical protein
MTSSCGQSSFDTVQRHRKFFSGSPSSKSAPLLGVRVTLLESGVPLNSRFEKINRRFRCGPLQSSCTTVGRKRAKQYQLASFVFSHFVVSAIGACAFGRPGLESRPFGTLPNLGQFCRSSLVLCRAMLVTTFDITVLYLLYLSLPVGPRMSNNIVPPSGVSDGASLSSYLYHS